MAVIVMIKQREALNAAFIAVAALYSFKLATLTPSTAKLNYKYVQVRVNATL